MQPTLLNAGNLGAGQRDADAVLWAGLGLDFLSLGNWSRLRSSEREEIMHSFGATSTIW